MMVRVFLFQVLFFSFVYAAYAQVWDDFSDGDFISEPAWQGDTGLFLVNNGILNSNGPKAESALFLSTPSTLMDRTTWQFYIRMEGFLPSARNKVRVFLASDTSNLEGPVHGYFVEIGQSGDDFVHFKRSDGDHAVTIFTGSGVFTKEVRICITRDKRGSWELKADYDGGWDYRIQGVFSDSTYSGTAYFGIAVNHTSSRCNGFYLDDILVEQLQVDTVLVRSATEVEVVFNQRITDQEFESGPHYQIGSLAIDSVAWMDSKKSNVLVFLNENTPLFTSVHTLSVSPDLTGNLEASMKFEYKQLELDDLYVLSDTTLQVEFNDILSSASALEPTNFFIGSGIGHPQEVKLDPANSNAVTLLLQNHLYEKDSFELSISNLTNKDLNSTLHTSRRFEYKVALVIDSVQVLAGDSIVVRFNKQLDVPSASEATNYFVIGLGHPVHAGVLTGDSSVVLTFDQPFESGVFDLTVQNVRDQKGTLIADYGNQVTFSYLNLDVDLAVQRDLKSILIKFNQPLDIELSELVPNYILTELGHPVLVTYNRTDSSVTLNYEKLFNSTYYLSISNLRNTDQNAQIEVDSIQVEIQVPTQGRMIICNEMMADPSPPVGLPEVEYVELYNPSDYSINLLGFELNGEPLPGYVLHSQGYVVVMDDSDYPLFSGMNNVIAVRSFDVLKNTGGPIVLKDQFSNTIDSLFYDLSWYRADEKSQGGFSLELIDPLLPCSDYLNWKGSESPFGGSPGIKNSVISVVPDTVSPIITSVELVSADTVLLQFSESIDEGSIDPGSIEIEGYNPVQVLADTYSSYYVVLDTVLRSETFYHLKVRDVTDCYGNRTSVSSAGFYFDELGPRCEKVIVLARDILAVTFHEPIGRKSLRGKTNFYLPGYPVSNIDLQDTAANRVHLYLDGQMMNDITYQVEINGLQDTLGNVMDSTSISFVYHEAIDTIRVVANNVLEISYTEAPVHQSAIDTSNYVVSKGFGRPVEIIPSGADQITYRLAFSQPFPENKPLDLFVENLKKANDGSPMITPAFGFTLDTKAPILRHLEVKNESRIVMSFDGPLNIAVAVSAALYSLNGHLQPSEVLALDARTLQLDFQKPFEPEIEYSLQYTGLRDLYGNEIRVKRKVDFVYDQLPPQIRNVLLLNDSTVRIEYSEKTTLLSATDPQNYHLGGMAPLRCTMFGPDSLGVELQFTTIPFEVSTVLEYQNIEDKNQNKCAPSTVVFDSFTPKIVSLGAKTGSSVTVQFNKQMGESARQLDHYYLDGFNLIGVNEVGHYTYELVSESGFRQGDELSLVVKNMRSLEGQTCEDSIQSVYESYFESVTVEDSKTIVLDFSTLFTSLSGGEILLDNNDVSLVIIDGLDRSKIRITFSGSFVENQPLLLSWKGLADVYGRGLPDLSTDLIYDTAPPEVVGVESKFFERVELKFSEQVDKNLALSINKYQMVNVGRPSNVDIINDSTVILDFKDRLENGHSYLLVIDQLPDSFGNCLSDTITIDFNLPAIPLPKEIIITEIMADPSPSVGLPEQEFLELHNRSNREYNLESLVIADESGEYQLPEYILGAGGYVVVSGAGLKFEGLPHLPMKKFPSLKNDGEEVSLVTIFGDEIDHVNYSRDWYGDAEKDDGGYSLELINPFSDCTGADNWSVSRDPAGGTPGEINSIYSLEPDTAAPHILNHQLLDRQTIRITFSETMDSLSLVNSIVDGKGLEISGQEVSGDHSLSLMVHLEQALIPGSVYEIVIEGLMDCSGNVSGPLAFTCGVGRAPGFNELLVTEIMADPDPVAGQPNSEYFELYNASDHLVALDGLTMHNGKDTVSFPDAVIPEGEYLLVVPTNSVPHFPISNIISISGWLTLANADGKIVLEHERSLVYEVTYSAGWHDQSMALDGGYSLEMKDLNNPCGEAINWGTSLAQAGGTPGGPNSNVASVPDNFGPNLLGVKVIDEDSIHLVFDERLDILRPEFIDIHVSPTIEDKAIAFVDRKTVAVRFSKSLAINQPYDVSVSGISDCNGNAIRHNNGVFVLPDQADSLEVIINEVLFNPASGGVDFVEVYNSSDSYFDLSGWQLVVELPDGSAETVSITEGPFVIGPGEHVALTEDTVALKEQYSKSRGGRLMQVVHVPNLPDGAATIALNLPGGRTSDRFSYHEDYHNDLLRKVDGVSLERISYEAPTQDPNNWISASEACGFATPGFQNSQFFQAKASHSKVSIDPKIFMPGSAVATEPTFTTIHYKFDQTGNLGNVIIYNQHGLPVKELVRGKSLDASGFLTWDGTNAAGSRVGRGYYVVLFEVYDARGNHEVLKETVVVGK